MVKVALLPISFPNIRVRRIGNYLFLCIEVKREIISKQVKVPANISHDTLYKGKEIILPSKIAVLD